MQARIDPLTGVFNSRYFAELAFKEISRSSRFSEPFTFAFVDVDNFKNVNDSHGHHQGDELLKTMTKSIRSRIRDIDIMASLGGDEFCHRKSILYISRRYFFKMESYAQRRCHHFREAAKEPR